MTPSDGSGDHRRFPIWARVVLGLFVAALVGGVIVYVTGDDDDDRVVTEQTDGGADEPGGDDTDDEGTTGGDDGTGGDEGDADGDPPDIDISLPDISMPEFSIPEISIPEFSIPPIDLPDTAEIAAAPDGVVGSHDSPAPVGELTDIGGGWRAKVIGVTPDGTAQVLENNQFAEPPPDGSQFTLIRVSMAYYGVEEPTSTLYVGIKVFGDDGELPQECGLVPDELVGFDDVFAGAVATGNVCVVTTGDEIGSLRLEMQGALVSYSDPIVLAASPAPDPGSIEPLEPLLGPQAGSETEAARRAPTPLGTTTDVTESWALSIDSPATDITEAITADGFSEGPAEGHRYMGVDVTLTYVAADETGFGGSPFAVNMQAVGSGNRSFDSFCGVVPDALDTTTELEVGGSVSGTVCFIVPEADASSGEWDVYVSSGLGERVTFFAVS